ncbi:hypothetical protein [Micromonospora fluostatini]|uniref:hypothetical protein n=1 Tax=Micromonospora sp. JCM 30529 TaxID=3421643 RepID=UPI003D17DD28
MQTVRSAVLIDVPQAAVIWLVLLAVVGVTVAALLVVRPGRRRLDVAGRIREAAMPGRLEEAEEERERQRYAQEVAVAAERAGTTAQRRRTEWLAAQEAVEAAWQAYQEAEEDVRRLTAAAAMPLPRTARTPAEYADRERFLHRTAQEAYRRQELSAEQLGDALAYRNGWDPRRHPVEQELFLRRAVRDNLLARHEAARAQEQAAWRAAELAVAAAGSLRAEAFAATEPAPATESSLLPGSDTAEFPVTVRESTPPARGAAVPVY